MTVNNSTESAHRISSVLLLQFADFQYTNFLTMITRTMLLSPRTSLWKAERILAAAAARASSSQSNATASATAISVDCIHPRPPSKLFVGSNITLRKDSLRRISSIRSLATVAPTSDEDDATNTDNNKVSNNDTSSSPKKPKVVKGHKPTVSHEDFKKEESKRKRLSEVRERKQR